MKRLIHLAVFIFSCLIAKAQSWQEVGTGVYALNANGPILALCYDPGNGALYAGGVFSDGATSAFGKKYVARWNGTSWKKLGVGNPAMTNSIRAMCLDASHNLYVASGVEGNAWCVLKWDGASWTVLGNPGDLNYSINTLCADPAGNIYAAGSFRNASGKMYVAKWNGTSWNELGAGGYELNANDEIFSITADNSGNVYAAGWFRNSFEYPYVAKWDGATWSQLGSGKNPLGMSPVPIYSLCSDVEGNVYAGVIYGDTSKGAVAKWNGTEWSMVETGGSRLNAREFVRKIVVDAGGDLYAATALPGTPPNTYNVAKGDNSGWSCLGGTANALNANSSIRALAVNNTRGYIYAAGTFTNGKDFLSGKSFVVRYKIPFSGMATQDIKTPLAVIYPNPAKDKLFISIGEEFLSIAAVNCAGDKIHVDVSADMSVDVSNWASGLYFFSVLLKDGRYLSQEVSIER